MRTLKTLFLALATAAVLIGCAGTSGTPSTNVSPSDGASEIRVAPGLLYAGQSGPNGMKLGISHSSRMASNTCVITAVFVVNADIQGLQFNINGEVVGLKPVDANTRIEYTAGGIYNGVVVNGHTEASKRFNATIDFVRRIVGAANVVVRFDLIGSYLDGDFLQQTNSARSAFETFLARVDATASTPAKAAQP